jgi:hypothetical protein
LTDGLGIVGRNIDSDAGEFHGSYARGTNTVKRIDLAIPNGEMLVLDTFTDSGDPGNDSGTGSFIFHSPNATVSGTFTYLADDTHCQLLAAMQLVQ